MFDKKNYLNTTMTHTRMHAQCNPSQSKHENRFSHSMRLIATNHRQYSYLRRIYSCEMRLQTCIITANEDRYFSFGVVLRRPFRMLNAQRSPLSGPRTACSHVRDLCTSGSSIACLSYAVGHLPRNVFVNTKLHLFFCYA